MVNSSGISLSNSILKSLMRPEPSSGGSTSMFVNDTFTDANNTLLTNHTADDGGTWTSHITNTSNDLTIFNNALGGPVTVLARDIYLHSSSPQTSNYEIEAVITFPASENGDIFGIVGRADSTVLTHYLAYLTDINNNVYCKLYKRVSGAFTQLATDVLVGAVDTGKEYTLKLSITDLAKTVYLDGVQVMTSDDNSITDTGKVGIHAQDDGTGSLTDLLMLSITASAL